MQVVRNGQAHPMTRDVHLPTGAVVTKDGFIIALSGQRTELREGQGCDLRGHPVAVRTSASGALTLAGPAAAARPIPVRAAGPPSVLEALFGEPDEERRPFDGRKWKKHGHGKGHKKGKHHGPGRWKDEDDE
jgi:hypothetical protein